MLSSIENLRREARDEHLDAIAAATGTPRSFFSVSTTNPPADSLYFRKNRTAPVRLTNQVKALFREGYRVATTILNGVSFPMGALPVVDTRIRSLDQLEIDALADLTRRAFGLDANAPIPNLTRALERAGAAVFRISLPGAEEGHVVGKGHYGVSYWGGPGERPVVGYFSGSGDRDRFTIAHEIGHLVLHTYRTPTEDSENQAHRFAGALLLPRDRAIELIHPGTALDQYARIKGNYGISIQASIMRAATLGIIDDVRKRSLMIQLSQRGWRMKEPVEVVHENPLLLGKALVAQWPDKPYVYGAEELGVHPQVLRSLAPSPVSTDRVGGTGGGRVVSLSAHPNRGRT